MDKKHLLLIVRLEFIPPVFVFELPPCSPL
jgi:hypothetical protein